jgi:5'-nucleotidase
MSPGTPRVVVTNDDGIDSPGLRRLAATLSIDFDVVVAAPKHDMSGSGTGIGRFEVDKGVATTPVDIEEASAAYAIDGPPGLAVMAAALGAFGPRPALVVSGVNAGINTGHSIIHSGTVGAALTAHTFEMKGLAVSLDQSDPWHWDTAVRYARAASHWLLARKTGPHVLNVNVPARPIDEVSGTHWADLDEFGYIRVATHDVEGDRLQFVVRARESRSDPATDTVLCSEGYVTVTPLQTVEPAAFPDVEASEVFDAVPSDLSV